MSEFSEPPRVLILESLPSLAKDYQRRLKRAGIASDAIHKGTQALPIAKSGTYDIILIELELSDIPSFEFMRQLRAARADVEFIILAGNASMQDAIDAIRDGAFDFLVKPFSDKQIFDAINGAKMKLSKRPMRGYREDQELLSDDLGFVGRSVPIQLVKKMIKSIANSKSPVFITGDSGTGKEVAAQAIHDTSNRSHQPFVAINCAAIPGDLMESEIFGHVKGAFTGAAGARKGAASQAAGGTLFLDEICEMDIRLQAKLLRFLQSGKIRRVGSDWAEDVDVRIICATNRNPMVEVTEKRFREDLFYRLNVLTIELPPLIRRGRDAILLGEYFLKKYAEEEGKFFKTMTPETIEMFLKHRWPGNIRELQNVIRKAVVVHDGLELAPHMISLSAEDGVGVTEPYKLIGAVNTTRVPPSAESMRHQVLIDINRPLAAIERDIIEAVIGSCNGSIPRASEVLKLSPSTTYRKRELWLKQLDHDNAREAG